MPLRFLIALALLASLPSLMTACSAPRLPDYPTMAAADYGDHKSNAGLTVAVHPMTDPAESQKYFGTNLLKSNVLAVLIAVDNRTPAASYFIQRNQIQLVDAAKESQGRSKIGNNTAANVVGGVGTAAILIVPVAAIFLLPVAGTMASDAAEIRRNFEAKELHMETVSPGDVKRGFVYFQLPKDSPRPMDVLLRIGLLDSTSGSAVSFDYNIHLGRN